MVSRTMVFRTIVAVVALLGAGSTGAAQTPVNSQVTADALHQVRVFENSLRKAIERAGQQLADRARKVAQAQSIQLQLQFEADIEVRSALMPEGEGVVFFVGVPGIEPSVSTLLGIMARRQPSPLPRVANPTNPPGGGTVTPGVVEPDPMVPPLTDPEKEYSNFTHNALVDAMLDNAHALPIREGQALTLVVGNVVSTSMLNPLAGPERMLYLRIKAEDLIALRQNRITRDEARQRIKEWRY